MIAKKWGKHEFTFCRMFPNLLFILPNEHVCSFFHSSKKLKTKGIISPSPRINVISIARRGAHAIHKTHGIGVTFNH